MLYPQLNEKRLLISLGGNKKGVFTRERRPKLSAHYFKNRWADVPDFNYKED